MRKSNYFPSFILQARILELLFNSNVVQLLLLFSVPKLCPTLCNPMNCSMPGFPVFAIFQSLLRLMFFESVMPSNCLILCYPLLFLPSIFPSIRVSSSELTLRIRWPKYWSFSFSISPSNEYSGLISFRIDWCNLLAIQGTLKGLLQPHVSKASVFGTQFSLSLSLFFYHLFLLVGG